MALESFTNALKPSQPLRCHTEPAAAVVAGKIIVPVVIGLEIAYCKLTAGVAVIVSVVTIIAAVDYGYTIQMSFDYISAVAVKCCSSSS